MACQALGRCRICARKHKIAVFGGEKAQHFFIEKAKLKLIILNTVCIECIGRIERYVKKMDLGMMVFDDYVKDEDADDSAQRKERIKEIIQSRKVHKKEADISSGPVAMDVGPSRDHQYEKNSIEASTASCNSRTSSDIATTQARPQYLGGSQAVVNPPHHSPQRKIGQENYAETEPSTEPCRKRPRNISKIRLAKELVGQNLENALTPLNSSSVVRSPRQTAVAFVNCDPISDCSSSTMKKSGRLLCCDFCKKEFTHAGDLNKHRRKHTGEKPYECNQCLRKFAHASNLARHQRVHSGEKPFACPRCARTFNRRDKLAIHVNAVRCQSDSPQLIILQEKDRGDIHTSLVAVNE